MKKFTHIVQSPEGLHARSAMLLAQQTKNMSSQIFVSCNGKTAKVKNMMAVLALRAFHGTELFFCVEGPKEEEDAKKLEEFCKKMV